MIYLDSSVALAHVLREARAPSKALWNERLVSSRLLEYEIWTRIHGRGLSSSHAEEVHAVIGRVALIELEPAVLTRALQPFPAAVRTLDALHLATMEHLRAGGQDVALASYDERLLAAARAIGVPAAKI